jgi:hypothetical protein
VLGGALAPSLLRALASGDADAAASAGDGDAEATSVASGAGAGAGGAGAGDVAAGDKYGSGGDDDDDSDAEADAAEAAAHAEARAKIAERRVAGLLARALIIIIAPMVILQTVIGLTFMDRHWLSVTRRLSAAVSQDIAAVIDVLDTYPQDAEFDQINRLALDRMLSGDMDAAIDALRRRDVAERLARL